DRSRLSAADQSRQICISISGRQRRTPHRHPGRRRPRRRYSHPHGAGYDGRRNRTFRPGTRGIGPPTASPGPCPLSARPTRAHPPVSRVIYMSSIAPVATLAFAERIEAAGARYLDAPVSGGEVGAKAGTLTVMVGGNARDFERARPIFDIVGKTVTHVGPVGC